MTKGKIEAAFIRLDRLGLGKRGKHVADAQESNWLADLFTSVIPAL